MTSCDIVSGMLVAVAPLFTINERGHQGCFHRIQTDSVMFSIESASKKKATDIAVETKEYQIEVEASDWVLGLDKSSTRDNSLEPYADEPLVDEEWLVNYKKEKEEKDQLENELKQHLENVV